MGNPLHIWTWQGGPDAPWARTFDFDHTSYGGLSTGWMEGGRMPAIAPVSGVDGGVELLGCIAG